MQLKDSIGLRLPVWCKSKRAKEMSKRNIASKSLSTKKPRLGDFNDTWEDDIDGDIIDDCIKRATQVNQEENAVQDNDVTLLSSYSIFKEPSGMFTSTQMCPAPGESQENLGDKIKALEEKYAEKEGEVSILRTNIKNLRTSCQVDHEKKQMEWKGTLSILEKENKSIKSELEFKNLEVANLKQQIMELSKFLTAEQSLSQKNVTECQTLLVTSPTIHVEETLNGISNRIYTNTEEYYPLKSFDPLFKCKPPLNEIGTRHGLPKKRGLDFCQTTEETTLLCCKHDSFFYPEVLYLINLSSNHLDSDKYVSYVNKVVFISLQLLWDFYTLVRQIEANEELENREDTGQITTGEIGLRCGEILRFLAEISPFSTHLKKYLLQEELINATGIFNFVTHFSNGMTTETKQVSYLVLVLDVVSSIRKTGREKSCSKFLIAVIRLLCRVLSSDYYYSQDLISNISKEMLLLRPNLDVIVEVTFFLNVVTRISNYMLFICSIANSNIVKNKSSEGVVRCDKEFCRFRIFLLLLENNLTQIERGNEFFNISMNLLNFTYNVFKSNGWLFYQRHSKWYFKCECLYTLYKFSIGIIYKSFKLCKQRPSKKTFGFNNFIKVLSLLTFNSCEITQKYIKDFAQFKEVVYMLIQLYTKVEFENLKYLEQLNSAEDFPKISNEKFFVVNL